MAVIKNNLNPRHFKLGDVIRMFDPLVHIIVWTNEDTPDAPDAEPAYEGSLFDLPWYFLDYEVGGEDDEWDGAFCFRDDIGNGRPGLVMYLTVK